MTQTDPPDEPPPLWRLRDLERRVEANELRIGEEIKVNIRNDQLLNGEFGLVSAMKANTAAIAANTAAIEKDREDRARFLRGVSWALMLAVAAAVIGSIVTGVLG